MKTFKKSLYLLLPLIGVFSLGLLEQQKQQSFVHLDGDENSFQINLTASNAPTLSTSTFESGEQLVRYTDFSYENARSKAGYHVELNANGILMNQLDSQITSITNITVTFATTGTLSLATSYDGVNFTSTTITSGANNATTSNPYFFKLVANGAYVQITSVVIDYSCVPHEVPAPAEVEYSVAVKSYTGLETSTDLAGTLYSNRSTYFNASPEISLSAITGEKVYSPVKNVANTYFKMGSSSAKGAITFTWLTPIKFNKIRMNVSRYSSENTTITIKTGSTTLTSLIPTSTTSEIKEASLSNEVTANTLTFESTSSDKRFHFFGFSIVSESTSIPVTETGISASDSKAATYKTTDVYSTANALSVSLLKSSGSPTTLSYDATGTNGYRYTVKNNSNTTIDPTVAFGTAGSYTVQVTYKSFSAPIITLTVTEEVIIPVTLVSVSATESKTSYKVGDVYLSSNQLVVTATYSDESETTLAYDATGEDGYTIYMLDPNADDFYPSNPFSIVGDYVFTVTYQGIESNDITITVGESISSTATINIGLVSASDSTNVSSELATYVTSQDIRLSSVAGANIFGGAGMNRLRFTSNKNSGYITITFSTPTIIQGVTLSVDDYNKTSSVKVATSFNTTGQNLTVSSGVSSLSYTAFSGDTTASSSITISSAAGNQFYLHGIELTLGSSTPVAVTGVSLSPTSLSLGQGTTGTLTPSFAPSNATNKAVTWSTSNGNVATVSNGTVTAVAIGTATITVTTSDGGFTATSAVTVTSLAMNEYYTPSTLDSNFNLQDVQKASDLNSIPSTGADVDILVIPIEFSDYPFAGQTLTNINTLFNGTPAQTNYWESVKSFYQTSSFNNLNMNFTVAPKYATGYTASQAANLNTTSTQYFSTNILRESVADYKADNGNSATQDFDSDLDGFIDAVWMIYSCPNYSNSNTIRNISTDYWAYVFWDYNQTSSTTSPNPNAYAWASYDFMYEGGGATKVDGHTYIHETGHLLGLDDYYNYDDNSSYKPMGGVDMMDYNVIDHNVWSKMLLGWQKPYVVTGNAEITISPSQTSGQSILIADNWNGTSYDEFLMLELYTPTGLNALDSTTAYNGSYPLGYTEAGIRLMHVDSRLGKYTYSTTSGWYFNGYYEPTSLYLTGNNYYGFAHSNTPSYSADPEYRLIHMIQAGGTNTFDTGNTGTNADLFKTGNTFSMATYGTQFFKNGTKLNNGNSLNYRIEFTNVSASSATIRIYKI